MRAIGLALYTVRVREAGKRREYERIDGFGPEDVDLLTVFDFLLNELRTEAAHDRDAQHVLNAANLSVDGRRIEGVLESGEYGVESTIRDVAHQYRVAHRRTTSQADMWPFYFLLDLPEGRDKGLLLLQRTGVSGIGGAFIAALTNGFEPQFPEYRLAINPVVPDDAVKKYVGGEAEMQEIRFIRHSLSPDITHAIGEGTQATGSMELVVRIRNAERFPFERRIRTCLNGRRNVQDLIELEETRFVYDNVKIVVKVAGRNRTVDLGNPKRLRATFDVSGRVRMGRGGHPRFESISEVAHEIMDDVTAQLYGRG